MERNVTIRIELNDKENECMSQYELTLEEYFEIEGNNIDAIAMAISEMNEEMDYRLKNDKARAHINLGQIYFLDLGASHPIEVRPTEFILDGNIMCDFLGSYPGKTGILPASIF